MCHRVHFRSLSRTAQSTAWCPLGALLTERKTVSAGGARSWFQVWPLELGAWVQIHALLLTSCVCVALASRCTSPSSGPYVGVTVTDLTSWVSMQIK